MSTCVSPAKKTPTEHFSVFGFVCGFLGVVAAVPVSANCAEDVARRVQARYESVRDLRAAFSQTSQAVLFGAGDAGLGVPVQGEVVLAKPGKMRWTYVQPQRSLVVSDGETLWMVSPDLNEAQRLPVTEGYLTGAALQFLMGAGELLESFDVSSESCPVEPTAGHAEAGNSGEIIEIDLAPKQPASYQRLGLSVKAASGEVIATRIVDLFGNQTVIAFENIEYNRKPGPATFEYEPTPEIEVIELRSVR